MLRKINYEEYRAANRVRFSKMRQLLPKSERVRRRPVTPERAALIHSMVADRWRLWLEKGWVQIVGPRHWRLVIPELHRNREAGTAE